MFNPDRKIDPDAAQLLIEELLRTGLVLTGGLTALSGQKSEDMGALIEMIATTCHPVIAAAGNERCSDAITLIQEIRHKFLQELRGAAEEVEPEVAGGARGENFPPPRLERSWPDRLPEEMPMPRRR